MAARITGALLLAVGATQLSTGWAGWMSVAVFGLAALLPYGAVLLGARLRLPTPVTAVGLLGVALAGLWITGPAGAGPLGAVRDAVPRLLTAPRPAPATPDLLAPGVLLAALVGLFVGVRASRPGGGRFAPVAGAAVLYVAGALLSAGGADRSGALAAALVAAAVAGWLLGDRPTGRRGAAAVGLGSAAVTTALVAALAPASAAFEPRELVAPPPAPLLEPNPLPRLAAYARQGDAELFRHTGSGDARLHLVALSDFNGASWRATARYRPVGAVAPSTLPGAFRRTPTVTEVTIRDLDGPWLPAPGSPTEVSLPDAQLDAESGSLVHPGGARPDLRYQVRSLVDAPVDADLAVAPVPDAPLYRGVPRLPFLFADYARRILAGASTPFEQAVLIENAVRQGRQVDPTAPAGSSYARLETFLFAPRTQPGSQLGTSEQFATAFAVLARAAGLPTRVVVGFQPGTPGPDGTRVVRGTDALAWPEVYFTGQGWVAFDPTPTDQDGGGQRDAAKREILNRVGQSRPPDQPPPAPVQPAPAGSAAPAVPTTGGGPLVRPILLVPLAGALLAVLLAMVAVARVLRRWRHRRAGARGAWSEVLDLLVLLGRRPVRSRPATGIAEDLAVAVPATGEPVHLLAEQADRATFAPQGTPVAGTWAALRQVRRAVRGSVPWYRRLLWPVDPRPLVRR